MGKDIMDHVPPRVGGEVPYILHSGYGNPSSPERFRPGPPAQLRPFHCSGVPPWRHSLGAYHLPGASPEVLSTPPSAVDPVIPVVCRPEGGNYQAASQGATTERVNIRQNMENSTQESSGETAPSTGPSPPSRDGM